MHRLGRLVKRSHGFAFIPPPLSNVAKLTPLKLQKNRIYETAIHEKLLSGMLCNACL